MVVIHRVTLCYEQMDSSKAGSFNNLKDSSITVYYGVYTPNDNKDYNPNPNVFEDKLEALKVAKKNKKSRFKAFQFYHEAVEFAPQWVRVS
ncbi:hypothetical protein NQ317_006042 [Molorchus minor]|uniref:Uncharacterized protein n=1 Tax=Molorchus minor TaxID=1323400 RepID=A0ABQ9K1U5_9CUCU|nr:hypothetical protein NQ317_006042 [Molorchus minor]